MEKRKASLNSESFLQKKRSRRKKILLFVFLGILLILGAFVLVSRLPIFQVEKVEIKGAKTISETEVKRILDDSMSGFFMYLIPKRSFFVMKSDDIEQKLHTAFPGAENIKVSLTPKSVTVSLGERTPAFLVCSDETNCLYADKEGFLYENAPQIEGYLFKRFYGGTALLGSYYEYKDSYEFAVHADTLLEPTGERIVKVFTENKRESDFVTTSGVKIVWSPEKDEKLGLQNLRAVLYYSPTGKPKSDEEIKSFFGTLDYVDVRFSGKVYFKNK